MLHVVQGDPVNDRQFLIEAASGNRESSRWIVPKGVQVDDEVVVYVPNYGFFATALIKATAKPRRNWDRRYSSPLKDIRLIEPPISLATIRTFAPSLTWTNYPRSITTPSADVAQEIRDLVANKRQRIARLSRIDLNQAKIDELREAALLAAKSRTEKRTRLASYRVRSRAVHFYVLARAKGLCEGCGSHAPFRKPDESFYLEPHHIEGLAEDGPDHPADIIGLCPNCHRRAHHSNDAVRFNASLKRKMLRIEPNR
jgi:hypothetical protein